MYDIKKLDNYFEFKKFSDVNFKHACKTLDFNKVTKKNCKTFWEFFTILKETNDKLVDHLKCEDVKKAEFIVQQVCTGSFSLGLEYVTTYTKNIELAISDNDHCKTLKIFQKYEKYNVFGNAEKVILRYKSRLSKVC